ncbi:MAG TPA: dienelactone hydrolase family protein [Vicinamibacterales bacterium]|jgi:carboxymethylenebutenolidase|nr:dienelactone hydrolase family protein [Vicinamibacterales bacterium]
MSGARVDLPTTDGVMDVHTFQPQGKGPWPAVIIYMDAYGIRPDLDSMAQRLADAGYFVVVPNLYYRTRDFTSFDPRKIAAGDDAERTRFRAQIDSINNTLVMRDTEAVIAYLDTDTSESSGRPSGRPEPAVKPGKMGAVGYCMGGGFAISALGRFPDRVAAAASFHGGSLATDKPDSPHRLAPQMRGTLYVGVAGIDPGFPKEQQDRLEAALREAGVDYALETYEGARHGFAVTGHMVYDRDASERHWHTLLDFFGRKL